MREVVVVVGLGSNIEPELHLPAAVERLSAVVDVDAVSHAWESPPVGAPQTPIFVNAAVRLRTTAPPEEFKFEVLRPIEALAGRTRGPDRWAPRTLDLDLVLYGDLILRDPARRLDIPDPDLERFAHVAVPAAEVWLDGVHPVTGRPLPELAAELSEGVAIRRRLDIDLGRGWKNRSVGRGDGNSER